MLSLQPYTHTFAAQVYRTEVLARALPPKSTLKVMSVSLATVALLVGCAAAVAHPAEAVSLFAHPVAHAKFLMSGLFPWSGVLYTGLLSTDLVLLIEVRSTVGTDSEP